MQSRIGGTSRIVSTVQVILGGNVFAAGLATYFGDDTWYSNCVMPCFRWMFDPERAHVLAIKAAHYGLMPRVKKLNHPELKCSVWKLDFSSPVGLAAGFDKHGEAVDGMLRLGFGFVEVGSVTPEPQEGNPKPRVFRLNEDKAIINRYGFNSDGYKVVYDRLVARSKESVAPGIIGINIGKNKLSTDAAADYIRGIQTFGLTADYIVMNVSSPNTPGLRDLQHKKELEKLVLKTVEARNKLPGKKPPLLLKISPDLSDEDKEDIAAIVANKKSGIDGLIVTNTTIARPSSLRSQHKVESGGLSGSPLRDAATKTIRDMYRLTEGRVPIIGVGGVSSGRDAYEKISAGASLVQIYTAMTFEGPTIVPRINRELAELLKKDGYSNVSEAVGKDFKKPPHANS